MTGLTRTVVVFIAAICATYLFMSYITLDWKWAQNGSEALRFAALYPFIAFGLAGFVLLTEVEK